MGDSSEASRRTASVRIDKRDFDVNRSPRPRTGDGVDDRPPTRYADERDGLLCDVVSEIVKRDRELMRREFVRMGSFVWGVLTAYVISSYSSLGPARLVLVP